MNPGLTTHDPAAGANANGSSLPDPPRKSSVTEEELERWFAELEKLRAERPYPTEEEMLAELHWYFEQVNAGKMGGYYGRYVGIYRKEVIGTDTDATRLEVTLARKYPDINPDRFFITHVS